MAETFEAEISRAILDSYHAKLRASLVSDVVIVGAGPSGLVAAWKLAESGRRVVVLEKRLTPGGGIWAGAMGMSRIVVEDAAAGLLDELGVRHGAAGRLRTADAAELAGALTFRAIRSGATLLNLMTAEDLCVKDGRVRGVVANRSVLAENFPIDPVTFSCRTVIDATGHEAALVHCLRRRGLVEGAASPGEGPMDAAAGEEFVVDRVGEVFPGLVMAGMSVCAAYGGPRMGPIFGGMLLSGAEAARVAGDRLDGSRPKRAD
jgi:thiamine thiazole synthase